MNQRHVLKHFLVCARASTHSAAENGRRIPSFLGLLIVAWVTIAGGLGVLILLRKRKHQKARSLKIT
jgi:hypothetical protein